MTRWGDDGYLGKASIPSSREISIFLSSGSDLIGERDHFEALVSTTNDQLSLAKWAENKFHLKVVRWEQEASRRTHGNPNQIFCDLASEAHVTLVLLHNDLRQGTREEIEAVLGGSGQLSILRLAPSKPRSKAAKELNDFLEEKKNDILWHESGSPGSRDASLSMYRILLRIVAEAARPGAFAVKDDLPGGYYEER